MKGHVDPPTGITEADALDFLRSLPDSSVDLIVTDPPYYRVKAEWWDRQWDTPTGFLAWIDKLTEQWTRVLKPNGSLYCFASPQMAARVEVEIGKRMKVLNSIVWSKPPFSTKAEMFRKPDLRTFFPITERIIFAEQFNSDNAAKGEAGYGAKCDELRGFVFEPLRAYLDGERKRAGIGKDECNEACGFSRSAGGMASRHYFSRSQWCLPTEKHYEALRELFNRSGGEYLRREYEDLRREYEELRRPFAVTADVPFTDVWTFPTVQAYRGKHPCEKPAELIRHIIRSSSRPNALVLDSFVGSGVTAQVAVEEGRRFIGSEIDPHWCEVARARIASITAPLPFARPA